MPLGQILETFGVGFGRCLVCRSTRTMKVLSDLRYRLELQKGHEPEEDWAELEQVLDMSEDQFLATVVDPSLLWS